MNSARLIKLLLLSLLLLLSGCATPRPDSTDNVCKIFRQYKKWYWAAQDSETRWGVPVAVQMAVIHQESRFTAKAKPARLKLLWVIPWKRPSSSYGYTQALKETWRGYQRSSGHLSAKRDAFNDAVDFIGWYAYQAYLRAQIPPDDAFRLYIAYHEGLGGYLKGSYRRKPWLIQVAKKVKQRADTYQDQLNRCQRWLKQKPWYRFW